MAKYTKEYVEWKISNCKKLVETATSDAQAEVYQGYLDFWTEKLPKKDRPEVIAEKEEAKQKKLEIAVAKREEAELAAVMKAEEELLKEKAAHIKAEKIAVKKAELAALEAEEAEILEKINPELEESKYANIFEIENHPKQAYYTKNGERLKTNAFKEYLNQITQ